MKPEGALPRGGFREWTVEPVSRTVVQGIIERLHYSKSINGVMSTVCFALYDDADEMASLFTSGRLRGGILYGGLGMAGVWEAYGRDEADVLELRRLVTDDGVPPNTSSFFVSRTLKWLKANTEYKVVLSYADPNFGHEGVTYRAANFTYNGLTDPTRVICWNGREYHDKTIRTRYNGRLKLFAQRLVTALDTEEAHYEHRSPKHIFTYDLTSGR